MAAFSFFLFFLIMTADCILRFLNKLHMCSVVVTSLLFHAPVQFSLSTGVSFSEAKLMGLASSQGTGPMPRDMSFPVPKGGSWHDLYDYIRYGNLNWEQNAHHWNCAKSKIYPDVLFLIFGAMMFGCALLFL